MKPCHFVFLSIDFRKENVGKGERVREAAERSMSGAPVAGGTTMPLSFKCFVAGREFERRMGDEH